MRVLEVARNHFFWSTVPSATLVNELDLRNYGGSRLFLADINLDGKKEYLWLQSAGMFKSEIYREFPEINDYMQKTVQQSVFCLTATDQEGNVIWQAGKPYAGRNPYLTHASEQMLKTGDINGDGADEILVLDDSDNLLMLDPVNGETIRSVRLPNDSFSTLYYIRTGTAPEDFILLVGVMDRAYTPHPYANPWLIINSDFEIVSLRDYKGAGHNVVIEDVNDDGRLEIMVGYQLINTKGEVLWTVDCWQNKEIDSFEQHADFIHAKKIDGEWLFSISGSDKQYLINSKGHTIWVKDLPHPQACLIGNYRGQPRIFVANQREIMNSLTLDGEEAWSGLLPEHWPMGKPATGDPKRPIHSSDPLHIIPSSGGDPSDLLLYTEGGWPYVIDFNGAVVKKLPCTPNSKVKDPAIGFRRINDIGLSFDAEVYDIDNDGLPELLVYNRNYLWIYKI